MAIPATTCWKRILYVVNGLIMLVAIGLLIVLIWGQYSEESMLLPEWTFKMGLGFAILIFLISILGIYGAYKSEQLIEDSKRNWALVLYSIIIFATIVLEIVAAVLLLIYNGVIQDAADGKTTPAVIDLENDFKDILLENPHNWIGIQDSFECCGYNNTNANESALATGKLCYPVPAPPEVESCRVLVLEKIQEYAQWLAALTIVVFVVEIGCLLAAFCLCVCIKPPAGSYWKAQSGSGPQFTL